MLRRVIRDGNLQAVLHQPDRPTGRCVVVFGGSGGGVPDTFARRVAEAGATAVGVAYFGVEPLAASLVEVPVDQLVRAIRKIAAMKLGTGPLGLVGASKGAELALLVAAHAADTVGPVIVSSPSAYCWYGLAASGRPAVSSSSWVWDGAPVPYLPYRRDALPTRGQGGIRVDVCYDPKRYPSDVLKRAAIPVGQGAGPFLLMTGADDHMWPSTLMADQIEKDMASQGRAGDVRQIVYPGAGHAFLYRDPAGAEMPTRSFWDLGGSPEADLYACRDAWTHAADFLSPT